MDVTVALLLRVGLLVYCVVVPGLAVLRLARFSGAVGLDRLLATLAVGAGATSLAVTLLLLAGVYWRPVLMLGLVLPAAGLIWPRRTTTRADPHAARSPYAEARPDPVDRAVLTAGVLFLAVYLLDAATSPLTWWDGLASWGKWAADWGRRTTSANYVVGAYPQLVPRLASVMYKITGAHSTILPVDFFALHAFYVLFAAWFLLAASRLTRLLGLPAWPVVLAGLGSMQFREHSAAGTVDVLVAALVSTVLALYLGLRRGTWQARHEWVVLGGAVFAALFTKWTGGLALVCLVLLHRAAHRVFPLPVERSAALAAVVRRAAAVSLVGMLPFVLEQTISELRLGRWQPDPYEVNISATQIPTLLSTDAEVVYRGGDRRARAALVQLRFWNSYDVPPTLRLVFTLFLSLCLVASVWSWFGRAMLPVLLTYGAIWLYWSSYDQRNLFGILPVLALSAAFGARRLWNLRPSMVWRNAVATLAALFVVLAGGGMLKDMQSRIASLRTGERALPARLAAMRGTVEQKVDTFYPGYLPAFTFLSAMAERLDSRHVLVTYPLFRFFPRGAHALSLWPYEQVQPGDLFAAHEWHRPPDDPRWVPLARDASYRIWVRAAGFRDVSGTVTSNGNDTTVSYDFSAADFTESGVAVWDVLMVGDVGEARITHPGRDGTSAMALDSAVCEPNASPANATRCSGAMLRHASGDLDRREPGFAITVTGTTEKVLVRIAEMETGGRR